MQCIGGQEAGLKAGSEVNMDEGGTPTLPYPPPPLPHSRVVSRILFYAVFVCFCTYSQSNGFVALNDWQQQQQQQQRLSDVGAAVGRLLLLRPPKLLPLNLHIDWTLMTGY